MLVSVVGLGCNNFGGRLDAAQANAVVSAAIDEGITLLDTADTYGKAGGSERALGEALKGRRGLALRHREPVRPQRRSSREK